MSSDAGKEASDVPGVIVEAYAAEAKPPLTQELRTRLHNALSKAAEARAAEANPDVLDALNRALDDFESELRSIVGPRVASLNGADGSVIMKHRSEAGQPLRAFGGQ